MFERQAHEAAKRRARQIGQTIYVVFSVEDHELAASGYHLATATDLDTYYAGIRDDDILAAYEPRDERENEHGCRH